MTEDELFKASLPKRFVLMRSQDVSGTSGVGRVADGVEFNDGTAVLRWNTEMSSTAIYKSLAELEGIHGHNGATVVVMVD